VNGLGFRLNGSVEHGHQRFRAASSELGGHMQADEDGRDRCAHFPLRHRRHDREADCAALRGHLPKLCLQRAGREQA
jgi:hypothetical protein